MDGFSELWGGTGGICPGQSGTDGRCDSLSLSGSPDVEQGSAIG